MALINKKILVDFGMAKATLNIHNEASLTFNILEKDGLKANVTETVNIKLTELRPLLYLITWKELNGNTVTQVHDYEKSVIYSNWTTPNGEFENVTGSIKAI